MPSTARRLPKVFTRPDARTASGSPSFLFVMGTSVRVRGFTAASRRFHDVMQVITAADTGVGVGALQGVHPEEELMTSTTENVTDPATGLTAAELHRAALTVCGYADDAAEARQLLEALGLLDALEETRLAS